ncbi:hypothetical protein Tco_1043719 [Tanacetum coccineum]|uniref:Uncharacterized protein n=1 Tax=Tanacetum coccineum TaxID=301880 RepID=A0ABQ5GNU7_9ASTR
MENQGVHALQDFEQPPAMDFTDNEIHSDSNIILYSQYFQETQQANVQDTHLQAQQDSMILSVIEQMSEQMINHGMHIEYLKYAQEQADILWGIVEQAKAKHPLDKELDFALQKRLLSHPKTRSRKLGLKCSTSNYGSKPTGNKKNDRISQPTSRNMKNKVEAQPRKVNKKNLVVEPICDDNVKYSKLNANSDLNCATCKKSLFDDVYDKCLLDFVKNVK